jgi:hypothetical protein
MRFGQRVSKELFPSLNACSAAPSNTVSLSLSQTPSPEQRERLAPYSCSPDQPVGAAEFCRVAVGVEGGDRAISFGTEFGR